MPLTYGISTLLEVLLLLLLLLPPAPKVVVVVVTSTNISISIAPAMSTLAVYALIPAFHVQFSARCSVKFPITTTLTPRVVNNREPLNKAGRGAGRLVAVAAVDPLLTASGASAPEPRVNAPLPLTAVDELLVLSVLPVLVLPAVLAVLPVAPVLLVPVEAVPVEDGPKELNPRIARLPPTMRI